MNNFNGPVIFLFHVHFLMPSLFSKWPPFTEGFPNIFIVPIKTIPSHHLLLVVLPLDTRLCPVWSATKVVENERTKVGEKTCVGVVCEKRRKARATKNGDKIMHKVSISLISGTYTCTPTHIYTNTCIHIYSYTHTHTHTYIYIYILEPSCRP